MGAPLPFGGEPVPYFSREDGGGVDTPGEPSDLFFQKVKILKLKGPGKAETEI